MSNRVFNLREALKRMWVVKWVKCWMEAWEQTHLGGRGAASGPSCRHICYTRWSRAARTRPPAPTLKRWSAPPCSRQTVASPPRDVSRAAKRCSGALGQRMDSGDGVRKQGGDRAGLSERRHPTGQTQKAKWESRQLFQSPAVNQSRRYEDQLRKHDVSEEPRLK